MLPQWKYCAVDVKEDPFIRKTIAFLFPQNHCRLEEKWSRPFNAHWHCPNQLKFSSGVLAESKSMAKT